MFLYNSEISYNSFARTPSSSSPQPGLCFRGGKMFEYGSARDKPYRGSRKRQPNRCHKPYRGSTGGKQHNRGNVTNNNLSITITTYFSITGVAYENIRKRATPRRLHKKLNIPLTVSQGTILSQNLFDFIKKQNKPHRAQAASNVVNGSIYTILGYASEIIASLSLLLFFNKYI